MYINVDGYLICFDFATVSCMRLKVLVFVLVCYPSTVVRHAVLEQYNACRSRKCICDCIPMYIFCAVYFLYFLQALFVSDFTSKTQNKDQRVEQLFFCPFVYVL